MNGFCGFIGWESSAESSREILDRMTGRLELSGAGERAGAARRGTALAVSDSSGTPRIYEKQGYRLALQGDVRLSTGGASAQASAETILDLYRDSGERVLERLRGAFALVLMGPGGDELLLAVDRIGGEFPVYYKSTGRTVVFATRSDSIQAHPLGRSEIDPQALFDYLYFSVTPSPRSVRKDVRRLAPASFLAFRDGSAKVGTYWRPAYRDEDDAPLGELCDEFRGLIRDSVMRHSHGGQVGCFLSGGTDSSTLAGLLGEATGSPARTYSIGFDAPGFDEMEYARTAAEAFRTNHHEYYLRPEDVVDAVPLVARAYSDPFGNASAVPTYHCARRAREDGIRRLLGGDGGDELFAGNQRYADQHLFALYDSVPRPARRVLEFLVQRFPRDTRITPVRKIGGYIRQARMPMPQRMASYHYLERDGPTAVLEPDFLTAIDLAEPNDMQSDVYNSADARTMLNRMLALDLKITIADNDLPKVSQMCRLAGVEVSYPFLDDEMVEFSCRVPARLKLKGMKLRWFMKHALRDFLPEKILRKRKHGFGLPFGLWMREHGALRDLARESLDGLKRRKVVRAEYIDRTVRLHETDHATYYGANIWVLMMLEQWYRQHEDAVART